ncbi:MAG: MFS transporter [Pseudomonadota bacterium]|nr:MFS transporter [Pseudomonadota bacterium]
MFMMFAMTTDSVGVIIPQIVREFHLTLSAASAFHYATMSAMAVAAMFLGFLPDRIGRKRSIVIGLMMFAVSSYLFVFGKSFPFFLVLLTISGSAIGIFKTGALALVGDISSSTTEHTSTMNLIEGFFGVGAIVGPLIVTGLIARGVSWKWLYAIAGSVCVLLIVAALFVRYPYRIRSPETAVNLRHPLAMARNPFALAFGIGAFLYVAAESAVYVFGPTYLAGYKGSYALLAAYGVTAFFALRVAGRFLGVWLLARLGWSRVLTAFSLAIFLCFTGSVVWGVQGAVFLLPLSGLFMSVIYPTLNSKGISCFEKSEHGAVAGLILFFTCVGAAVGPLAMGVIADRYGDVKYGFMLATGCAGILFIGLLYNWLRQPTRMLLEHLDQREYGVCAGAKTP